MSGIERWKGKVAIVTGASAGMGAAIAEALVKHGLKVAGIARRSERVEALARKVGGYRGRLYPVRADVSKEQDIVKAFKWVTDNVGPVHILINNAGITQQTSLTDGDTEKWRKIFDLNVLGLSIATREAIKIMKANNIDGHIVHINSVVGHDLSGVGATVNVYGASKFAVTALTETLRQELIQTGSKIKVSSISPGPTVNELVGKVREGSVKPDPARAAFFKNISLLDPEDVAEAVVYVVSTPPHVQVHEIIMTSIFKR